jgi:PiT family inorganic phosphate transporter
MSDFALNDTRLDTQAAAKPDLHRKPHVSVVAVFLLFLVSGIVRRLGHLHRHA